MSRTTLLCCLAALGCTTLGPMPASTGIPAEPAARPDVELQVAALPGYYLSSAVREDPKGTPIKQASVTLEADRWISLPGVVGGARYVGEAAQGGYLEPLLGYRSYLDSEKRFALAGVAFATHASGNAKSASFSATRAGAELGAEFRLTPQSHWAEIHALAAATLTGLDADGEYCLDAALRYGVDCSDDPANPSPRSSATAGGLYPALNAGLAVETADHLHSVFHGARLVLMVGGGTMPIVVSGEQADAKTYASLGAALTLGLGASE